MGEKTKIEWCDSTFSPWSGCAKIDVGCEHCAAEHFARRFPGRFGTWGRRGKRVVASETYWRQPFRWNRAAEKSGVRRRVFCGMMMDVFEDRPDLREPRARLLATMYATPNLDWLLLTKRPQNIMRLLSESSMCKKPLWCPMLPWGEKALPSLRERFVDWSAGTFPANVWLGTSVSTQADLDRNLPHLLRCPAAMRFLSIEPLLEPVVLSDVIETPTEIWCDPFRAGSAGIGWIIAGCESGPKRRHISLNAFRSLRDRCVAADVPFFLKQIEVDGRLVKMPEIDDKVWSEFPEVRRWPSNSIRPRHWTN